MGYKNKTREEYHLEWREKNKDRLKEYQKSYREANKERHLKWLEENKEKVRETQKTYIKNNFIKYCISDAKKRSKRKGLPFSLCEDDVTVPEICPILLLPLYSGVGCKHDFSPSLDRIDNTRGYVKGNVQILSDLANRMKSSATPEQLLLFADWVYKTYGNKTS